jgi:tRNA (guanosine-2'-O-)-methyltransferase
MSLELRTRLVEFFGAGLTPQRRALFYQVLERRTRYLRLILDGVENVGDACAVMRSCECFGIQNLDLVGTAEFRPNRGIAVGASKWIDLAHHPNQGGPLYQTLHQRGYRLALLTCDAQATPIHQVDLEHPLALVLPGPAGYSSATQAAADLDLRLPTVGFTDSFNLSVTAALCLSSLGQRLRASAAPWQLGEEERLELLLTWMVSMPKRLGPMVQHFLEEQGLSRADLEPLISRRARQLMFG